jgi:hypothetical protein
MTTPFGWPVLPEVKMMSAAPRSSGRSGGGRSPQISTWSVSIEKRAPVARNTPATVAGAAVTWTGTATAPARHTPSRAPKSDGRLPMRTCTGSPGFT